MVRPGDPLDIVLTLKREKAERELAQIERTIKQLELAAGNARENLLALDDPKDFRVVQFAMAHGYLGEAISSLAQIEGDLTQARSRLKLASRNLGRALLAEERLRPSGGKA